MFMKSRLLKSILFFLTKCCGELFGPTLAYFILLSCLVLFSEKFRTSFSQIVQL